MADNPFEEVDLNTPSGEMVTVRVPRGMSDDQIKSMLRQRNPELFQAKSAMPEPNAIGAANKLLAAKGIQVSPLSNPINAISNSMQQPSAIERGLVSAGAALSPRAESQQPIFGQGKSPIQVMANEPLPVGSPSAVYNAVAEPAQRIGSGDVAGGVGQAGAELLKAYLLKKAGESLGSQPSNPAGADLLKQSASQRFSALDSSIPNNPVAVTNELSSALSRYQQLVERGGSRSLTVSKLLNRVTNPQAGPLSYTEARDFYSNLSRLSSNEFNNLTPKMQAQVGKITQELGKSIQQTTNQAGMGETYSDAMRMRREASSYANRQDAVAGYTKQLIKYGIPATLAGALAKHWTQSK